MLKSRLYERQQQWFEKGKKIDLLLGNIDENLCVKPKQKFIAHWIENAYN